MKVTNNRNGEPGTTVKVELPDGTELTGVADDQGNYGIDIPANQKFRGGEQLKVTSTDASGNKSDEKVIDVKIRRHQSHRR